MARNPNNATRYEVRPLAGWRRFRFELVRRDTGQAVAHFEHYNDAAREREKLERAPVELGEVG